MKVLVLYDLSPESSLRTIVKMTESEYEYFKKAHGIFINFNDDKCDKGREASLVINQAFCSNPEYLKNCNNDKEREYFGKWKPTFRVTNIESVDRLIASGFFS